MVAGRQTLSTCGESVKDEIPKFAVFAAAENLISINTMNLKLISPIGQATTVDGEQLGKRFPNEEFLLLSVNVMFPNSQCFLKESMLFKSGSIKNNENVNLESTTSFE